VERLSLTDVRSDPDTVLKELTQDNPEPLACWLTALGVDVDGVRALPQWNSHLSTVGGRPRHRRLPADFDRHVGKVMDAAFRVAVDTPLGAALLCCYVRNLCEQAWKNSYHFDRMWATLRGARRAWLDHRAAAWHDADRAVTDVMCLLLEVLDWEIAVENEMIGNNLERLAVAARRAAGCAGAAVVAAEGIRCQHPQFADFASAAAGASRQVDLALAEAGRALHGFLSAETGGDSGPLDAALRRLAGVERGFECDRDQRSELRAYRNSLAAICAHAASDWLHIDEGTVVHAYPFAVRGMQPVTVVAAARASGNSWNLDGVRPEAVHQTLYLDDIWNGSDAMGRRYEGAVIVLPEVTIDDLDGRPLARLAADLRLSELGNHYLRLRADLREVSAHDLYGAMLRSAPEHAEVRVRCGGSDRMWPRLSAFAVDVIDSVGEWLGPPAAVSVRPGMFHVLVTVLEASLSAGPDAPRHRRRPVRTTEELLGAVGGGVLQQPVPNIIGAPVEWVHYAGRCDDLTAEVGGRRDELIGQTCNTTVIAALGSPAYCISTRLTVAEFVASLEGLFAGWFDALAIVLDRVTKQAGWSGSDAVDDVEELTRRAQLLEEEQMRLYTFAADARSTLDLIRSPALVASPLVSRELLALLRASSFDRREAELSRNIDAVLDERLGYWLDALVRRRREKEAQQARDRERRQRVRLDTMLAVIAAVGISGLGQIAQAGYDLRRLDALTVIIVIVTICVLVGAVAGWWSSDFARPRSRQRRGPEAAHDRSGAGYQPGPADDG